MGLPSCLDNAVHALVGYVGFWGLNFARTGCQADMD